MRWTCPLLGAALLCGACETPIDDLPADTVVVLHVSRDEGARPNAPDAPEGPPGAHLRIVPADERTCVALPEEARFSLNGVPPDWHQLGGRGQDPFSAFSPDCLPPDAYWDLWDAPVELSAPFVFILEDGEVALRAELDEEGAVLSCDFSSCATELMR